MRWVAVVAVVVLAGGAARADEAHDQAKELSDLALRKSKDDRDYLTAVDLFAKAYALAPDRLDYLLDEGIAARKANLPNLTVALYRQYLATAAAAIDPALKDQLEAEIALVQKTSATVVVATGGAPAAIELDGRAVGTASAGAPLVVLVPTTGGAVATLRARRAGDLDATRELRGLVPGVSTDIALEPAPRPTTARLAFTSVPDGARLEAKRAPVAVRLDRAPQVVELVPGDYEIVAHLADHADRSENVHVVAGEDRAIVFRLPALQQSFVARHKLAIAIAGGAVLVAAGVLAAPTVNGWFVPDHDASYTLHR